MEVKQIYELMNTVTGEVLGKTDLVQENLENVVDVGNEIFNANAIDNYVKSLVNHIGRVIFVNRPYRGNVPSVLMDGWEYGSVCEKISAEMPEATENESWQLEDGTSYDPNIFYQPKVSAKFFNKRVTFEVPMSFTEMQVKESFSNAAQLNGFISMIYNEIDKSITVKIDSLIMRTIDNMIGATVHADYPSGVASAENSGIKAVNLLTLYKAATGNADLTVDKAITSPEFIRYASYMMGLYETRMSKISTLFNIGGKARFTPSDMLHVVLLADFAKAAGAYLQSDTYHNEFTALPNAEIVPFWQASGTSYKFDDTSKINIVTADNNPIEVSGILGVMFDRDALGVCNQDRRVTSNWNAKAEFWNQYAKFDCQYFNDENENFVVFFVA